MRNRAVLLVAALQLFVAVGGGQTALRPAQVRDWSQVSPPGSSPSGTRLHLEQLGIDPAVIADWAETIRTGGYDHFRMAVVLDQPNPVLIVCIRREDQPFGPGCVGGLFWFAVHRE